MEQPVQPTQPITQSRPDSGLDSGPDQQQKIKEHILSLPFLRNFDRLKEHDPEVFSILIEEMGRQEFTLAMIPSENYISKTVLNAAGSIFNNKYAEGYSGKRYYQGGVNIDNVETLAIERAKKVFGAEHVNVQALSGSPANMAIYFALLKPGDKIMGLRLDMGGHLTHGHKVNFSSQFYQAIQYSVDKETGLLDMDKIREQAQQERPKIIVSGATAYPRTYDFKKFHEIAEEVGAYSMADVSHIAGLIAGGAHPSPFPFTDVVMTTTHKTLRGSRGALIMSKVEDRLDPSSAPTGDPKLDKKRMTMAKKIDRAVFPGLQGGPHEHTIAAHAVTLGEALKPEFKDYAHQIVKNAKVLAGTLMDRGIKLVSNGTDNHLILIDLTNQGPGLGKPAAVALEKAGIVTNCNTVPYDPSTPFKPSGVRIGTPCLTTRGMKEDHMKQIGEWMAALLTDMKNEDLQKKVHAQVIELCKQFPFY